MKKKSKKRVDLKEIEEFARKRNKRKKSRFVQVLNTDLIAATLAACGGDPRGTAPAQLSPTITIDDIIVFLDTQLRVGESVRMVKRPRILSSKEKLQKVVELSLRLVDLWFSYEAFLISLRMRYESDDLPDDFIKEWAHILKDIKPRMDRQRKKYLPRSNSVDRDMALENISGAGDV
jgi:hypothetical protein